MSATAIACVVQVVTDLELVAPIAAAIRARGGTVVVWVRAKALKKTPELRALLDAKLPGWGELDDDAVAGGAAPDFTGIAALIAPTESNAPAHRFARQLVERAHAHGVRTATLQHGFDNIGLTWFDGDYPPGSVDFAAQRIFTWGPEARLHPAVAAATRAKCVAVGCSKAARADTPLPPRPDARVPLIAVFENLHWNRYSESYRAAFVRDLEAAVAALPGASFFVRPHPAGRWLTERSSGKPSRAANLVIAAPDDRRFAAWTTPALLALAQGVITTPSTVALDAARAGRPVAVAAYDLALPDYAPLPMMRGVADWTRFAAAVATPAAPRSLLEGHAAAFVARACVEGDGAARIAEQLLQPPSDWGRPERASAGAVGTGATGGGNETGGAKSLGFWRRLFGGG